MGEINLQPQYLKDSNGNRIAPITTIEAVKFTDDLNLTDVLDDFGASGDMHKSGFVPDPGSTSGNSKALYEDGTWKDTYTKTESDNKYATKTDISSLATVAISGSYNDLSDKPAIPATQVNSDWNASSGVTEILHKPNIPTKVSDLTNDAGYTTNTGTITSVKMNGSTIASSGDADLGTVITSHQDISGKANKSEMSVVDGTGTDADKTTITLKTGTSVTVLKSHQSLSRKQDVIDSSHKLSADFVDDTSTTNKFTNATEKQTWNNKQDAITDLATIRSGAALGASAVQTETDPTVPSWAKASSKPTYTASEVGALPDTTMWYGTSTTAAATVQKEVSIPSITTLRTGQIIVVKPTITSTVANSTLKLNNFDAYPMRYNNAAITTSTDSVVWGANFPSIWIFDGDYWVFAGHGLDSNTTYSAMSVAEGTAGTATSARTMRADYLKQIIEASIPTAISSFTNDAGYLTQHQDISGKQDVIDSSHKLSADLVDDTNSTHKFVTVQEKTTWNNKSDFSGSYNDLTNKPTIPATQVQSDWNATSGMGVILNKPTIPTVPTNVSAFTNDAGYLTQHQDISGKEDKITIDSTTKQASFTAIVGNYYNVTVPANSSITITLATPASTYVSSCIFKVYTNSNPSIIITAGNAIYYAENYEIESDSTSEINALFNGNLWFITSVKFSNPTIN